MQVDKQTAASSKGRLWTGRILSILVVLFLLFDSGIKFTHSPQMLQICAQMGLPVHLLPVIGVILLICTVLYAIPQTAPLGALFLTGYLGGAVAIQMRADKPVFDTVFPHHFRGGALGRPFSAAGRSASASSSSEVAGPIGMHSTLRFLESRPSMNESTQQHVQE